MEFVVFLDSTFFLKGTFTDKKVPYMMFIYTKNPTRYGRHCRIGRNVTLFPKNYHQ